MDNIFQPGLPSNLVPNAPGAIPEPLGAGDAMGSASPFSEPQNVDQIIAALKLNRPLKLFIPNREKYPDWEFHVINSIPNEIADAHNKGFKEVTDPDIVSSFRDLVAGTDKDGKSFRPILCARPKAVGEHVRQRQRMQLQSLYAGMDPKNKEFQSGYAKNAVTVSEADYRGPAWKIRIR